MCPQSPQLAWGDYPLLSLGSFGVVKVLLLAGSTIRAAGRTTGKEWRWKICRDVQKITQPLPQLVRSCWGPTYHKAATEAVAKAWPHDLQAIPPSIGQHLETPGTFKPVLTGRITYNSTYDCGSLCKASFSGDNKYTQCPK